jgi:hypothetical protein
MMPQVTPKFKENQVVCEPIINKGSDVTLSDEAFLLLMIFENMGKTTNESVNTLSTTPSEENSVPRNCTPHNQRVSMYAEFFDHVEKARKNESDSITWDEAIMEESFIQNGNKEKTTIVDNIKLLNQKTKKGKVKTETVRYSISSDAPGIPRIKTLKFRVYLYITSKFQVYIYILEIMSC